MRLAVIMVAFISTVFVAPVAYMVADNQPPYEYDAENSYIVPTQTASGRQITVHWRFKHVNRVCSGLVTRYIVDDSTRTRVTYDPTPAVRLDDLDGLSVDLTFLLPQSMPAGLKWYYSDGEYACNLLQHIYPLHVRTPRLSFEVLQ